MLLAVVCSIVALFLYHIQNMQPVHFLPVLRHLHALADEPKVKQVECLVKLKH